MRVDEGQPIIQATSDVLLGWARWQPEDGRQVDFYFRRLWDGRGRMKVDHLLLERPAAFAGICGRS